MQTEWTPALFEFEAVDHKKVVAGFDGGTITSDAGALLLGQLDRGLGLIRRMATCFTDGRHPGLLEPSVLLTNERRTPAKLITLYAQRRLIENAIADAVRFFHMVALSSAVGLKVDFDMALLVIASTLYRRLAQHMRGYSDSQARQVFRDLVDMPADVCIDETGVTVRFHRRAHLPIVLASGLLDKPVNMPWWDGACLRLSA